MAVMQNSIIFGGVDSADYGIYIGGEGTFNAPKRDVEMISIPGRNGTFALDKGRFENIEVTYSAFNYESDLATFAQNLSGFRNAICSQKGYQRLTDTFHTDEYRMAAYIDGLDIKPINYNTASTFEIKFDCKPQRFLTSGETAVTVTSGGTITNPTPFDSHPLLKLYGYGDIQINSDVITASGSALTEVELGGSGGASVELDMSMMNTGDPFYSSLSGYPSASVLITNTRSVSGTYLNFHPVSLISVTGGTANAGSAGRGLARVDIQPDLGAGFENGTSKTVTTVVVAQFGRANSGTGVIEYFTATFTITTAYDGDDTITISASVSTSGTDDNLSYGYTYEQRGYLGMSSKIILPSPAYIDLENGEAYGTIDGQTVSVNSLIVMPPELPVLKSGNNTITFDNTFTKLEVVPRWWKV